MMRCSASKPSKRVALKADRPCKYGSKSFKKNF